MEKDEETRKQEYYMKFSGGNRTWQVPVADVFVKY